MDFMLNNVTGLVLIFLCVVQVLWGVRSYLRCGYQESTAHSQVVWHRDVSLCKESYREGIARVKS